MQKLLRGLQHFQTKIFGSHRELFERLSQGQAPEALFITCSDSRINPNMLTNTQPGELLILRNAGNIIPPYGAVQGGEAATVEFAVAGLGVEDIIVCGHTHCGAMKSLLDPPGRRDYPALTQWLAHAESTHRVVREKYADREAASLLSVTIQENVLAQMENLRTHPVIASGLSQNKLKLHGWVYKIETGEVFGYDPVHCRFDELTEKRQICSPPSRNFQAADI
ncbi:MAG: carbonic anhydrase [Methylococcales bacterium]|nr:carbonic anhydrase [Methylococcales bacterium]